MAGKTAILSVRIIGDGEPARKELASTGNSVEQFGKKLDKLAVPAAAALAGVGLLIKTASDAASALQQAQGGNAAVFGAYSDQMEQNAKSAAQNVGLAQSQYLELGTVLGAQLKNMGVPMDAVAGQTDTLIGLGADLAATFGGTTADAVSALSSLLKGETDPIERYGVGIKQADIQARLAAQGLDGLTGEAEKQAKTQAILAMLTEQTADAQGMFASEIDTAAGATQVATAKWEDAAAKLGTVLLPMVVTVATALSSLAGWMGENETIAQALVIGVAALAAGILILNVGVKTYLATQALLNSAFVASIAAKASDLAATVALQAMYAVDMVKAIGGFLAQKALEGAAWITSTAAKVGDLAAGVALNAMYAVDAVKASAAWIAQKVIEAPAWAASILAKGQDLAAGAALNAMYAVDAVKASAAWIAQKVIEAPAWAASILAKGQDLAAGAALNVMYGVDMVKALGVFLAQKALEGAAWVATTASTVASTTAGLAARAAIVGSTVAMGIATAAQWAWNVAMSANPIGLIILAIAALVAAIVWVVANWQYVQDVAIVVWSNIRDAIDWVIQSIVNSIVWLIDTWNWLGRVADSVWSNVRYGIDSVIGAISGLIGWFADLAATIGNGIGSAVADMFGWGGADVNVNGTLAHAALGGGADPGEDGTGGWPTWAASSSTSTSATTLNVNVKGDTSDARATAREIASALDDYFTKVGKQSGGASWQPR